MLLLVVDSLAQSTITKQIQYLSGTNVRNTKTWNFYCTGGRNSGTWTTIQVPSHWEQQGFGSYNYGRDNVTYGKNFRYADEKGLYKHQFIVPASWANKEVKFVFEGSMTDTEVKINGKIAGHSFTNRDRPMWRQQHCGADVQSALCIISDIVQRWPVARQFIMLVRGMGEGNTKQVCY